MRHFLQAFVLILVSAAIACAYEIHFQWTPQDMSQITGYRLYYTEGINSRPPFEGEGLMEGPTPIEVPKQASTTAVSGLDPKKAYRFALTAYLDAHCSADNTEAKEYTYPSGKIYCESGYSDIVNIPIMTIPGIKYIIINAKNIPLNTLQ